MLNPSIIRQTKTFHVLFIEGFLQSNQQFINIEIAQDVLIAFFFCFEGNNSFVRSVPKCHAGLPTPEFVGSVL